jgi:hypothetical protein
LFQGWIVAVGFLIIGWSMCTGRQLRRQLGEALGG